MKACKCDRCGEYYVIEDNFTHANYTYGVVKYNVPKYGNLPFVEKRISIYVKAVRYNYSNG